MPQMANITVKKNDGTTDVIYTQQTPSAGDRSPAVWKNLTVGTASAHRPEFRISATSNGPGTARRITLRGVYPTLVTGSDGRVSVADRCVFDATFVVPSAMPDSDVNEAASQIMNLCAATLTKDSVKQGYAPA